MAEYIERGAFIELVKDIPMWGSVAAMFADIIPAADVAPVVHGRWVDGKCSNCGVGIPTDDLHDVIFESDCHFCYSCGAMMDGGECDEAD